MSYLLCKINGIRDCVNIVNCKKYAFVNEAKERFLLDSTVNKDIFMQLIFEEKAFLQIISDELFTSEDRVYHTAALNLMETLIGFLEESEDFISRIRGFAKIRNPSRLMKMFYMLVVYKKLIFLKETEGKQNTMNKVICYAIIQRELRDYGIDVCRQSLGLDVVFDNRYGNSGYYAPNKIAFIEGMKDHSDLVSAISRQNTDEMSFVNDVNDEEANTVNSLVSNFLQ
jgi:hypothetical protein